MHQFSTYDGVLNFDLRTFNILRGIWFCPIVVATVGLFCCQLVQIRANKIRGWGDVCAHWLVAALVVRLSKHGVYNNIDIIAVIKASSKQ
jgi:hypothetical protein